MKNKKFQEKCKKLCFLNALSNEWRKYNLKYFQKQVSTWNKLRILFLEIKVSKQNFVSKYNIIFVKIIIKNLKFDFEKIF